MNRRSMLIGTGCLIGTVFVNETYGKTNELDCGGPLDKNHWAWYDVHRHGMLTKMLQPYVPERMSSAYVRMYGIGNEEMLFLEVRCLVDGSAYGIQRQVDFEWPEHVNVVKGLLLELIRGIKASGVMV